MGGGGFPWKEDYIVVNNVVKCYKKGCQGISVSKPFFSERLRPKINLCTDL